MSDLHEVFVPFEVSKLKEAKVVFSNKKLLCTPSKESLLSRYAYVVDDGCLKGRLDTGRRTFYAERYGGDAILRNGGGGRCGFDGEFQLKGLGPNQLVADDAESADGNGLMSLGSAIYETIWAEIIHIALPYGAVRSVAILDAGLDFEHKGKKYSRGLLVRVPAVRPAHFIRAVYFKEKQIGVLTDDAKRVRAVVKRLVSFLPADKYGLIKGIKGSLYEQLKSGLSELAKRFARQFAIAKTRRIVHYNISASNLSLDGAWLDFSSARIFSGLIVGDKVDIDNFMGEHVSAVESIENICYYLSKYEVIGFGQSQLILREALETFTLQYNKTFKFQCVLRVGFPSCILNKVTNSRIFFEFSEALQRVLGFDDFSMAPTCTGAGWDGYDSWECRLFMMLFKGKTFDVEQKFSALKVDAMSSSRLITTYSELFDLVCNEAISAGISRASAVCGMAINLVRLNRTNVLLVDLDRYIEKLVDSELRSEKECAALVECATNAAYFQFYTEDGGSVPFWISGSAKIWYNMNTGLYGVEQARGNLLWVERLSSSNVDENELVNVIYFYGDMWGCILEKNF
ncbi:hypothetical protein [Pseudomonas putida]|uniref:hypothetical protein n=1 Tax=Pseudomonas putida TaxID=303 RepID=UPI0013A6F402|nr:hypothetical protein [Pseudomonas putida]